MTNFHKTHEKRAGLKTNSQLIGQVASDNLDVTKVSVCLLARLASGNQKPLGKTEFLLFFG